MKDDVANAILFLASDESKYITGIELTIDGGLLAGAGAPPTKVDQCSLFFQYIFSYEGRIFDGEYRLV